MKATVTVPFSGVKDGAIYPMRFCIGQEIEGDLARSAVADGKAKEGHIPVKELIPGIPPAPLRVVEGKIVDPRKPEDGKKTAKDVLDLVEPMKADFLAWKSLASEVLGENCPAKKADIIEALKKIA